MELLISIIIPCYNVDSFVLKNYDSIFCQRYENWEAIFIDDGSTDRTLEILHAIQLKDSRVRVISQENKGVGSARNLGLSHSKGEYILFVDPDDWIEQGLLAEIVPLAKNNNSDVIVFGYNEISTYSNYRDMRRPKANHLFYNESQIINSFFLLEEQSLFNQIWNKLYKRELILKCNIKFSDISIGEDTIFNMEVFKNARVIETVPVAYYNYLKNREGSALSSEKLEDNYVFFKKYIEHKKLLFNYWKLDDNGFYVDDLLKSAYGESIKVFLSTKNNKRDFKYFKDQMTNKKIKKEVDSVSFFKVRNNKSKIKLLLLKIPIINYFILSIGK